MENNYNQNGYGDDGNRSNQERSYDFYEVNREPVIQPQPEIPNPEEGPLKQKHRREKTDNGIGKRFGITITTALVFGLVAGLVFQGVNLIGNKVFKTNESTQNSTVENVQMVPSSGKASSDDGSQKTSGASVTAGALSVADIARNATPSIVAITAVSVQEVEDFFGRTQQYEGVGSGSGIIIGQNDDELLIATNNHVVADAKDLSVSFYGDEVDATALEGSNTQYSYNQSASDLAKEYAKNSVSAQIKGTDADNDLAVIAVKKKDIPEDTMSEIKIATMGDSNNLVIGEQVVAIGNALGYGQSVTSGWISALDRSIQADSSGGGAADGLIQTDAAINPGNSGGALFNMKGEVVGINSAKFADETVEGMGFAIPVATAQPILDDLMNRETRSIVDEDEAAYMGISCKEVPAEVSQIYGIPTGVFVAEVTKGGPAEKAGVQSGDVLTKFDGTKITSYDELTNRLQYYAAGETVDIVIQRADSGEYKDHTLSITLGSKKDAQ